MKLIYTTKTTGFEPQNHYRNPLYFDRPEKQATTVVIEGDFPEIVSAYQALGIEVEVPDKPSEPKKDKSKGKQNDPKHTD